MRVLVTGANGFIGQALVERLSGQGCEVTAAVRNRTTENQHMVGEIDASTDWRIALNRCDLVIHLAGRVHQANSHGRNGFDEFRRVNVLGTENLASQAAEMGVRRLIFLSSIKVNGSSTKIGAPFTTADLPRPDGQYGITKWEAERSLKQIGHKTGMEIVIIRPPLVYGPSVKGNFQRMIRYLKLGVPLPLASVNANSRSLVALDNLLEFIVTCACSPSASNQTFLVSDGEDLSTADLLTRLGAALGYPPRLFRVPDRLLKIGSTIMNKRDIYERLCGSLQVDITKARDVLGWHPPTSVDEGLKKLKK